MKIDLLSFLNGVEMAKIDCCELLGTTFNIRNEAETRTKQYYYYGYCSYEMVDPILSNLL